MNYKKYYYTIIKNLKSKKVFYKYYKELKTYEQFLDFSEKILSFLVKNGSKKRIITYSNKSFEMYSSILPILISNSTWIPLSVSLPVEKVKFIISAVKPDFIFYDHMNKEILRLFKKNKIKTIKFSNFYKIKSVKLDLKKFVEKLDINSEAFIYFTSGSTGEPKGISVDHKNIIADIYQQQKHLYNYKHDNLVFGDYYDTAFSIFFDIYFPAIYFQSSISPGITKSDIYLLADHFIKNQVNTLVAVPSSFSRIQDYVKKNKIILKGEYLIITGEPFYLNLLRFIFMNFKFKKIYNCYGGTEMGNWVFYHRCKLKDLLNFRKYNLVPIGKPFSNTVIKVLANELVVSGPTITSGYLNKALNKNKFIFGKNNTFYTGDKVIKRKGIYICKGRSDGMVKIHGYRIEIPEVEANLRKISYVNDVVVFEKKNKNYTNKIKKIVKFFDKKKNINSFKEDIKKFLPNYMIPKDITLIDKMPKNINGKLDRKKIKNNY